jgi:hypothetical protein
MAEGKQSGRYEIVIQQIGRLCFMLVASDGTLLGEGPNPLEAARAASSELRKLAREGRQGRVWGCQVLNEAAIRILREAGVTCRFTPLGQTFVPAPIFASWDDYTARTSPSELVARCRETAKRANRKRLLSTIPELKLTSQDVWAILEAARGRCVHCGSLAVERRPSNPITGAPLPWEEIGRRIGSLEHIRSRFGGGDNHRDNLAWSCLWCNTWRSERRLGATDHGGYFPTD